MYSKIINPETGRAVNVNGRLGKHILSNYINTLNGGSPPTQPSLSSLGLAKRVTLTDAEKDLIALGLNPKKIEAAYDLQVTTDKLKRDLTAEQNPITRERMKSEYYKRAPSAAIKLAAQQNKCSSRLRRMQHKFRRNREEILKKAEKKAERCEQTNGNDMGDCGLLSIPPNPALIEKERLQLEIAKKETEQCKQGIFLKSNLVDNDMKNSSPRKSNSTPDILKKGFKKFKKAFSPRRSF